MYDKYKESKNNYKDAEQFIKNVLKGFYVHCTHGDGTILYINDLQLRLNFTFLTESSSGKVDSLVNGATVFAATKEVIQANRFQNSDRLKELAAETEHTYLKTPAGIFTEVTLPVAEMMANGDSINSAKIIFTRYNNLSDTQYRFGTPQTLLMVRKSELGTFFEKNRLTDNISSYYTTYSSTFNRYEFNNIARLIIHCENERQEWIEENMGNYDNDVAKAAEAYESANPDWNKVVLVPVTTIKDSNSSIVNFRHDLSLNSTRLVGGRDKIEIKVICSTFNQ